ncbi:DUF7529 family protein, partial [Halopiger djelfimassiliensis]|uniref:DUF7529 family protein n=1 Tax=Halopiger djelfimassiliensis TaxID=1293047 RepID=UPI0009DC4399
MSDGTSTPTADPRWTELLEDTAEIADEYRNAGWDAVVLEPSDVSPSERADRFGFDVRVSDAEYGLVETLVGGDDVTFGDAEVYYRPADGEARRFALVVERDRETETAVCLPLTYSLEEFRPVFETALPAEELLVHVRSDRDAEADETDDASDRWLTFSHDDPSLFLEESDVRNWTG